MFMRPLDSARRDEGDASPCNTKLNTAGTGQREMRTINMHSNGEQVRTIRAGKANQTWWKKQTEEDIPSHTYIL